EAARAHETLQKEIDAERTAHAAARGAAQEERQRSQASIQDLEGKIQQAESARGAAAADVGRLQDEARRLEANAADPEGQRRAARQAAEDREREAARAREALKPEEGAERK